MSRPVPREHQGLVLGGGLRLALMVLGPKQFATSFCKRPAAKSTIESATKPSRRLRRSRAA